MRDWAYRVLRPVLWCWAGACFLSIVVLTIGVGHGIQPGIRAGIVGLGFVLGLIVCVLGAVAIDARCPDRPREP